MGVVFGWGLMAPWGGESREAQGLGGGGGGVVWCWGVFHAGTGRVRSPGGGGWGFEGREGLGGCGLKGGTQGCKKLGSARGRWARSPGAKRGSFVSCCGARLKREGRVGEGR